MTISRRVLAGTGLAMAAILGSGRSAEAQAAAWPERPVRVILPFPPGGGTDVAARLIAQHLQTRFGQPFTVENRSGGAGVLGTEMLSRAAPDGYTLAMTASGPMSILPQLQSVPYDPIRSFAHVALPSITPLLLVTPMNSPTQTLPALLERLRREPGRLTACNIGVGSPSHLAAEMFARAFGVQYEQLPHRGSAPALTDTVSGTCDFLFDSTGSSSPLVRQGMLRALGVTALDPVPSMPEIPTIASFGPAGFQATTWSCLLAPAGTPEPIVTRINSEVRAFTATPAMQQRLRDQGSITLDLSPQEFRAYLEREIANWGSVIRAANIRLT
jgi:tripartite-type tricarboxylate transporter receptor subunit TctC